MSWVAEANAMIQNRNSDHWKKLLPRTENATSASTNATMNCIATTHSRLVRVMSTSGLHSGLITHGRYNQLVYSAMSVFEMPRRLYITTDIVITMT